MHQIIVIWYKNGTHFLDKRGYNFVTLRPTHKTEWCSAAPLFCFISRVRGIQISGVDNAEIVCFEILDLYGNTEM